MSKRSSWRALVGAVAVCVLGLGVAGCSGTSDDDATPIPSAPTVPSSDGDSCVDPVGDLSASATADVGTGTEPAGIDIISASAQRNDDQLDITFTTAGSIDAAASPTFVLAQGNPFDPMAFEVRVVRDDASGAWAITMITWDQAERRRSIVGQPAVDGSTIAWSIPMADLPPLAIVMIFGATADGDGQVLVFDDCSALNTMSTGG